jgi:hypothetical protein
MYRHMRISVFGIVCGLAGWVMGHAGLGVAGAQQPPRFENKGGSLLQVRGFDEQQFTDKSKKFALEIYQDSRNGATIYITDTGSMCAVPAK